MGGRIVFGDGVFGEKSDRFSGIGGDRLEGRGSRIVGRGWGAVSLVWGWGGSIAFGGWETVSLLGAFLGRGPIVFGERRDRFLGVFG